MGNCFTNDSVDGQKKKSTSSLNDKEVKMNNIKKEGSNKSIREDVYKDNGNGKTNNRQNSRDEKPDTNESPRKPLETPQNGKSSNKDLLIKNENKPSARNPDEMSEEPGKKARGDRKAVPKIKRGEDAADVIHETIKRADRAKTQNDIVFIITCLKNHFVFHSLSENELESIVEKMFYATTSKDQNVFKQGDAASSFFILEKGNIEVVINGATKKKINPGDSFGELALLYNAPRSATLHCMENCTFWAIDRSTFRKAIEEMMTKEYEENRQFIENVKFFQTMTGDQKDSLASVLFTQKFSAGQNIVSEGDPASSFYIIKDGTCQVLKGATEVRKLFKGESFGEQALYFNTARQMTVRAQGEVKILALGRDTVQKVLGNQVRAIVFRNIEKWALEKNPYLAKLNKVQVEKICDNFKESTKRAGEVVFKKGQVLDKMAIFLETPLKKISGPVVAPKGAIYGDECLLESYKTTGRPLEEDLVMDADGSVAEMDRKTFMDLIGGTLESIIKKNEEFEARMQSQFQQTTQNVKTEANSSRLETLIYIKKLGFGQFGSVYLVKAKETNKYYALKCVSKAQITAQSLEKHLLQEKNVLQTIQFPFIMQYIRTFKDDNFIYFLVEFIRGMELFDAIREIGLLNVKETQFYVAQLVLALEHLHSNNIIYRDLKPENVMVEANGYLKLIDMGTAKMLKTKTSRTFTIIGTPHYMAPEVLTGKGYGMSADLWSIGICVYEFMCGQVPFGEEAEDPYEIYEEVIKKDVVFPNFLKDKKTKKMMEQLLSKVPEQRLGSSYAALKANPWFDDFDWDKLLEKVSKPPWVPPKEKVMSDDEIKKAETLGKLVLNEIKNDLQQDKKGTSKKTASQDTTWDKDF